MVGSQINVSHNRSSVLKWSMSSVVSDLCRYSTLFVVVCLCQFSGTEPNQHKRVSVKSNPGFLERLSETAGGTVFGIGLFFLSIYILFTNEVRNTDSP